MAENSFPQQQSIKQPSPSSINPTQYLLGCHQLLHQSQGLNCDAFNLLQGRRTLPFAFTNSHSFLWRRERLWKFRLIRGNHVLQRSAAARGWGRGGAVLMRGNQWLSHLFCLTCSELRGIKHTTHVTRPTCTRYTDLAVSSGRGKLIEKQWDCDAVGFVVCGCLYSYRWNHNSVLRWREVQIKASAAPWFFGFLGLHFEICILKVRAPVPVVPKIPCGRVKKKNRDWEWVQLDLFRHVNVY